MNRALPGAALGTVGLLVALLPTAAGAAPAARIRPSAFAPCTDYDGLSALGSPQESVSGQPRAGLLRVRSLSNPAAWWSFPAAAVGKLVTADARFGFAAIALRVNTTDQCTDLVVGAPGADGGLGMVAVIPGSAAGPDASQAIVLDPAGAGLVPGDRLGWSVSAVSTEAGTIIAAGAPGHDVGGAADAGAVVTWLLPAGGPVDGSLPTPSAPTLWTQGANGLLGKSEAGDRFGTVLAAPGQNGNSALTIGIPDEDIAGKTSVGSVAQLMFTGSALSGNTLLWQGHGMPGLGKSGDRLGAAVAAPRGTIEAIGLPGKDANGKKNAGAVIVRNSLGAYKVVTQDTKGVPDKSEKGDEFGAAVGSAFGVRGVEVDSIAVGAPGEDLPGRPNVGQVTLVDNGTETGPKLKFGLLTPPALAAKSRFGQLISVFGGDLAYDEDMRDNLLIAAPGSVSGAPGSYFRSQAAGTIVEWESGVYAAE